MNAEGDMFYTENQGPWNGACSLKQLKPGALPRPSRRATWYERGRGMLGPPPREPKSGSRMMIEAKRIPELLPPAVYFPYPKMGQSASGIACDTTGGKFGPFAKQLFVGDQTASTIMRVVLEKVDGRYQGACIPFREGFASGNLPLLFAADGSLFVGGTNRGWGSRGTKPFALERLVWTGKVPFEIHEIHARPDGFELTFTEPVDAEAAGDAEVVRCQHVHLHLPVELRQPRGRPDRAGGDQGHGRPGPPERPPGPERSGRGPRPRAASRPASVPPGGSPCFTRSPTTR